MKNSSIALLIILFSFLKVEAQNDVVKSVQLDEVVINAQASGFSIEEFMQNVKSDSTFYKAFLNLKYFPHRMSGEVLVFNKKEKEKGQMFRVAQLLNDGGLVSVKILEERTNGKIKNKNGEFKYLTAEMYDEVFFPKTPERTSNLIHNTEQEIDRSSKFDRHKSELKKFMFNPGSEISSVPFIGDKMAIFGDDMVPYYDYFIWTANYADSIPCWVFTAKQKEGVKDGKTVIKDLTSWFDQETMSVMLREYTIRYNSMILDFDIHIKVTNTFVDGQLVPERIEYNGNWDIPFKKAEVIDFWLSLSNWEVW